MNSETPVIEIERLVRRYGRRDAVDGLNLRVRPGRCYGFFGRNGAGKTTTIKCLLNLLRPTSGAVRVFGLDPARDEVAVKSRLAYVPDNVAFYPWMSVRDTLDYCASFRERWNQEIERALLDQFRLDARQKTSHLSKGQRTQLALITASARGPSSWCWMSRPQASTRLSGASSSVRSSARIRTGIPGDKRCSSRHTSSRSSKD
jgi:ABC-2 type transport system ATP-binding protein